MGYDLLSVNPSDPNHERDDPYEIGDLAYFNIFIWPLLLELAVSYGWKPAGTRAPIDIYTGEIMTGEWDGSYCSNDGQVVIKEDAASLADALERALPDIPDHEIPVKQEVLSIDQLGPILANVIENEFGKDAIIETTNLDLSALELFSGLQKHALICFIKLCRKDAFVIR
jgi:hypothetical protein